jgi:hypothetical protein
MNMYLKNFKKTHFQNTGLNMMAAAATISCQPIFKRLDLCGPNILYNDVADEFRKPTFSLPVTLAKRLYTWSERLDMVDLVWRPWTSGERWQAARNVRKEKKEKKENGKARPTVELQKKS